MTILLQLARMLSQIVVSGDKELVGTSSAADKRANQTISGETAFENSKYWDDSLNHH